MVSKRARAQLLRPKTSESAHLTPRQAEVLRLAAHGLSEKQIARRLGISVRTVEDHFAKMRQHTGTRSQGELIAYEATVGLLAPQATAADRPGSRNEVSARRRRRRLVLGMISATRPQTGAPIRDETRPMYPAARDEMQRDNSHCQVCGAPITEAATGRPRVYCSRACQQRAYRTRQNTARMAGPTILITGIA